MAAQTMVTAHGSNVQHGSTSSTPYPPLPASPTLTNPDMILPDYDRSETPDRSESPLLLWKNAHVTDMQFQISSQNAFIAGPITPTTPIIYGNGTMLSDIGEVTEVESTPGKGSRSAVPRRLNGHSDSDAALRSSPTMGYDAAKKKTKGNSHERRSSIESTSTITTQDQAGLFADFDDTVSVDDSNFQGDDEDSVAESYVDDTSVRDTHPLPPPDGSGLNADNRYSTTLISRRAEAILANAKRRLTTMEGNLSRARSLHVSSPSASSLGSITSTPSPPIVRTPSAMTTSAFAPGGHARMLSETTPTLENPPTIYPRRSASALGAAGGYRQPLTGSKSVNDLNGAAARVTLSQHPLDTGLEPLSEDEALQPQAKRDSAKLDNFLSPTFGTYGEKALTRSASAMQVRDLKDQVKDLKGKISNLREQARADSMKRRSLQSLRTPSPFTHAQVDNWYTEPTAQQNGIARVNGVSEGRNPWNGELSSVDGEEQAREPGGQMGQSANQEDEQDNEGSVISSYVVGQDPVLRGKVNRGTGLDLGLDEAVALDDDNDDMLTEDGNQEYDEDQGLNRDYGSESGDSLYHDSHQTPVSHEDREDAFDYEHFFLHSAMGTISQQRLSRRGSSASFGSDDSVETTRGPHTSTGEVNRIHRKTSVDTISTMESFATADDGETSRRGSGGSRNSRKGEDAHEAAPVASDERPPTPQTARKAGFGPVITDDDVVNDLPLRERNGSLIRRPMSANPASSMHRPSVSSFESTGTNRSFPLVNKPKIHAGVLTPQGSPDQELKNIAESLMSETASVYGKEGSRHSHQPASMQMLPNEDQLLVERVVANLGKCVLGLSESNKASTEYRMYRRRIDAARRMLEGLDSF